MVATSNWVAGEYGENLKVEKIHYADRMAIWGAILILRGELLVAAS